MKEEKGIALLLVGSSVLYSDFKIVLDQVWFFLVPVCGGLCAGWIKFSSANLWKLSCSPFWTFNNYLGCLCCSKFTPGFYTASSGYCAHTPVFTKKTTKTLSVWQNLKAQNQKAHSLPHPDFSYVDWFEFSSAAQTIVHPTPLGLRETLFGFLNMLAEILRLSGVA